MTISLYSLYGTPDNIRNYAGDDFSQKDYSLMKAGGITATSTFGYALGLKLIEEMPDIIKPGNEIVLPVAYQEVKPACFFLTQSVENALKDQGYNARIIKINKSSVTTRDYAASTAEERVKEMSSIQFSIDEDLTGTHVILVDDIKITGLAEKTAMDVIVAKQPLSATPAYVAITDYMLASSPHVEGMLNNYYVKEVTDMLEYICKGGFNLTIRFLKRTLGSSHDVREQFYTKAPLYVLEQMLDGAQRTGESFMNGYADGITHLHETLRKRK